MKTLRARRFAGLRPLNTATLLFSRQPLLTFAAPNRLTTVTAAHSITSPNSPFQGCVLDAIRVFKTQKCEMKT